MRKNKISIQDVYQMFRQHGMGTHQTAIADGIADGTYPFGRVVRISENGRRTFEIFRLDVERFITEKTGDIFSQN